MGGEGAADFTFAQIDQPQFLTAAGGQLGSAFKLPALSQIEGADDGNDRARVGVAYELLAGRLTEGKQQLVPF